MGASAGLAANRVRHTPAGRLLLARSLGDLRRSAATRRQAPVGRRLRRHRLRSTVPRLPRRSSGELPLPLEAVEVRSLDGGRRHLLRRQSGRRQSVAGRVAAARLVPPAAESQSQCRTVARGRCRPAVAAGLCSQRHGVRLRSRRSVAAAGGLPHAQLLPATVLHRGTVTLPPPPRQNHRQTGPHHRRHSVIDNYRLLAQWLSG